MKCLRWKWMYSRSLFFHLTDMGNSVIAREEDERQVETEALHFCVHTRKLYEIVYGTCESGYWMGSRSRSSIHFITRERE